MRHIELLVNMPIKNVKRLLELVTKDNEQYRDFISDADCLNGEFYSFSIYGNSENENSCYVELCANTSSAMVSYNFFYELFVNCLSAKVNYEYVEDCGQRYYLVSRMDVEV